LTACVTCKKTCKLMMSSVDVPELCGTDFDDKNAKVQKQGLNFIPKQLMTFFRKPGKVYSCFLAFTVMEYVFVCGGTTTPEDLIGYVSCILEAYGLISVYNKIQQQQSVSGISGMSLIMFALSYSLRATEMWVMSSKFRLSKRGYSLELLQVASVPLIFSLLWAVFKTYRHSYEESKDVLKVKYLVPGCVAMGFILTPQFRQGKMYSYCWATSFYMDVLALLPQVVMMAYSPGQKVAVPIANFVAATAFSRSVDLWFWYFRFDLGPQGWWHGVNVSGWTIVIFHVVSLLLVADFMYYYVRGRLAARLGEDKQAMSDEARGMLAIDV